MSEARLLRDYSLTGPDEERARRTGLAGARWYSCPVPRSVLKELMRRKDGPAVRDTLLWFGLLGLSGTLGWLAWGTWLAVPCFLCYGVLYGSASDSRWHECGHGTAFRTRWLNEVVYQVACVMILREPTVWRWSHARHHSDTLIVGRDPEIAVPRPPSVLRILLNLFALRAGAETIGRLLVHAAGRVTEEEATFIPTSERRKLRPVAWLYLTLLAAVVASCVWAESILPAMFVGLPTFYGAFLGVFFSMTQHAGLAEDVLDHRLDSRTVLMNPVFRFLYWNMNYHVEHHMFPLVPYHALPRLHEAIRDDCPRPYSGCLEAYREIVPALIRQMRDPRHFVVRPLPPGATISPASAAGREGR